MVTCEKSLTVRHGHGYARCMRSIVAAAVLILAALPAHAQVTLVAPFNTDYSFTDLGSVPSLPAPAGGLVFLANDPSTLLIGGAANSFNGKIYTIGVVRDASQHVTGFTGTATYYADAHGIGFGGIDGGLTYGPGGLLFYTSYSDNSLGQLKPASTMPDRQDALTPLGVASSVGSVAFVPPGFAGAGRMKLVQYNGAGNWYDVVLGAAGANGTYPIGTVTQKVAIGGGPEGVIYVDASNPQFGADSVLVSEYSAGKIATYTVDANGDPNVASRRDFMTGLTGAEGAAIDPVTGDFFFSTFGGGNRVIVVRGFVAPSTTTSTTTTSTTVVPTTAVPTTVVPTTSSTSTVAPTTSSSSTSTSASPSTAAVPSTTSTTLPSGDCAFVPVGATFPSIVCRLAALVDDTEAATALGSLRQKALQPLGKAVDRTDDARSECASNDAKHARARLKQVVRQLIQYSHKLRTRAARKRADEAVREPLAAEADAIQADVRSLRAALACPGDAGSP